jgi:hypothetical protein
MMFVGVLTNAIFAMLLVATASDERRPSIDNFVFAGLNIGLVGFVVSLLAEATWLEQIATPVLGVSILAGLVERTLRLREGSTIAPPPVSAVPAPAR